MCLAVPGRVIEWLSREGPFGSARVEFGGVRRAVNMACVPEAADGDYVLVHAGIAICLIDADEASRILHTLTELALIDPAEPVGNRPRRPAEPVENRPRRSEPEP
jgi:hydrogenase expression/formation protein HypC